MRGKWYERVFYRYAGNCYRTECLERRLERCLRCPTYWILKVVVPLVLRDVRRRLYPKEARQ